MLFGLKLFFITLIVLSHSFAQEMDTIPLNKINSNKDYGFIRRHKRWSPDSVSDSGSDSGSLLRYIMAMEAMKRGKR